MISCDEAALICNKSQYEEASLLEKFKLKLHILFCSTCSSFSKRNKQLSQMFGKTELHVLSDSSKKQLKQEIRERL
ncbi:hypothetical protein [Muriicola marianensis]|uniref:Zf-HC2 domain-containing protein n=1 Tax=Muriicola marianensis TaxID=1324801 RepID=A0ABQ1R542_9FLAO|nr:hypothetical protein [Muriicola marianensis]GGD54970.1 hypothetical protein GCM10011361_21890 [Muriicola marianensis]